MEALTYRLDRFEGPLDLLLNLIQKNKVNIEDIPISLICEQYMAFIEEARRLDMEIASEFIVMASELMLIKSKMLLPRVEPEEEDPRAQLAEALIKYRQAKEAATKLAPMYALYSGRMVKDVDEISIDRSFVTDQEVTSLCAAVKRILAYNDAISNAREKAFTPMIAKPIVPVEVKIVGIINHIQRAKKPTMRELLADSVSLPDMIAIFLGILELMKVGKISIDESECEVNGDGIIENGENTRFILNEESDPEKALESMQITT
ncbi:MAG: segregation/condensation protein A [Clostridia bacterium]|nr:segregation/condensation protein A [Clostridia bacterium]